jgi:Tfp pilus assembly protein PilF
MLARRRRRPFDAMTLFPLLRPIAALAVALSAADVANATPFTPTDDAQVLERVSPRATDPRARELQALRAAVQARPRDAAAAVALVERLVDDALAEGDPRPIGQAQAALAPWWDASAPPPAVRVQRAVVRQYGHDFERALADLDAALAAEPANLTAWSWKAALHMVQADYAAARAACERLALLTTPLTGTACTAAADALTGRAADAALALDAALRDAAADTSPAERLWALTRLAEIEERRGAFDAAERAFGAALALKRPDVYLLAAYADFLLDRGRPADVLALLGREPRHARADVLLLRLALAAKAANDPRAAAWRDELRARFDAARTRGDSLHEKEEARFALALLGEPARALALARSNFGHQREPADARLLLEAALAARDREAAAPALQWLDANRIESVALQPLAERVKALQ